MYSAQPARQRLRHQHRWPMQSLFDLLSSEVSLLTFAGSQRSVQAIPRARSDSV